MAREKYSLDVKIERALNERGIEDVSVDQGLITCGSFAEKITGVITPARLDALAEKIKAATGGGAG